MKKNEKVSLFVILFGFSIILIGILLFSIVITCWEVIFVQVTYGLIFILSSLLLITAGAYLILRFIT